MSDSTTHLDTISSTQAQKEITANAVFNALSPAAAFGRRALTSLALVWGYYGSVLDLDGTLTQIPDSTLRGTIALVANSSPTWIVGGRCANTTSSITAGGITKAAAGSAVINSTAHPFAVGDTVLVESVSGMTEMNNTFATITAIAVNTFNINTNTTNFTTWTSGGTIRLLSSAASSIWKQGKCFETVPPPGMRVQYQLVVGATATTSYTDWRASVLNGLEKGILRKAMSDANQLLTAIEVRNLVLQFTGTLSVARDILLPRAIDQHIVYNNTTGGFGLVFKSPGGTGVTVAAGMHAMVYSNGSDIVRATADV